LVTLASLVGSLAADTLLVMVGTALFPSTRGYVHFRFSDYGELTTIGVLGACLSWVVIVRISSAPRRLFLRLAVLVTLVLWIPDLWILAEGQPPRAVAVLMVMHLAIALVTYNLLVRLAPVRFAVGAAPPAGEAPTPLTGSPEPPRRDRGLSPRLARRAGIAMGGLVGVELALGIGTLVVVPYDRPDVWVPGRGQLLYLTHAILGSVLGLGAVVLLLVAPRAQRLARLGAIVGFAGVLLAAAGGVASVDRTTRLFGVGLMLVGAVVGGFGYLMLTVPVAGHDEPGEPPPGTEGRLPSGP
jgi:hypothetical protein